MRGARRSARHVTSDRSASGRIPYGRDDQTTHRRCLALRPSRAASLYLFQRSARRRSAGGARVDSSSSRPPCRLSQRRPSNRAGQLRSASQRTIAFAPDPSARRARPLELGTAETHMQIVALARHLASPASDDRQVGPHEPSVAKPAAGSEVPGRSSAILNS